MTVVITGDSLAYNRYDYEPSPSANAFDCPPDMGSWSFRLRDYLITRGGGYVYGSELIGCGGLDAPCRIFGDKSYTGVEDVEFSANAGALYFQKHGNGGVYRLYADDIFVAELNFKGNPSYFCGMEPFNVKVPDASVYTLKGGGLFTLSGAGINDVDVYLTGQGSRCASFFNENFYDRIGRFAPDILIMIIGSNDSARTTARQFAADLDIVISKTMSVNPDCKVYLLTPTKSDDYELVIPFNAELKSAAKRFGCEYIDLFELFDGYEIDRWRFDNVHMTKFGNNILFEKMKTVLG